MCVHVYFCVGVGLWTGVSYSILLFSLVHSSTNQYFIIHDIINQTEWRSQVGMGPRSRLEFYFTFS